MVNTMPFAYRFHPMVRELRARVQSEEFGAVNLIHGSYLQDWLLNPRSTSWRVDAEGRRPVPRVRRHRLALVRSDRVGDRRPDRRTGRDHLDLDPAAPRRDRGHASSAVESDAPLIDVDTEDTALILFRTANDIAGSAVISQLSAGRKNRLWVEIDGMQRSAVFDQELPEQLLDRCRGRNADPGPRSQPRLAGTAAAVVAAGRSRPGLRPVLRELRERLVRGDRRLQRPRVRRPRGCRPSPTEPGRRRSVTPCCGPRRAGNG